MKKCIYVASPYTKGRVVDNIRNPILVGDELIKLGYTPFLPLLTHFWDLISPHSYEEWMTMDFVWILKCDALLRLPGESSGADREVEHALAHDISVFHSVEELDQYFKHLGQESPWDSWRG